MKTVLLRAPTLSQSGYGVHARQVFKWLNSQKGLQVYSQIVNWGNTPWYVNPESQGGIIGQIMASTNGVPAKCDVAVQLQLPDEWDTSLGNVNIGMSALVETDVCNKKWIDACNKMNAVIVPSAFTRDVLLKSSYSSPLKTSVAVVPESYPQISESDIKIPKLDLTTDFNFLIVSQLTSSAPDQDRKNIMNTIRWICQEFSNDSSVGIIVKTNSGRSTTIDRAITKGALRAALEGVSSSVRIYMLHGDVPENEMMGLYRHPRVKALVSLTRGEGFGLPLLEAASSGLPVIATSWSAHTEFLGKQYIPVAYDLTPIPQSRVDGRIFVAGARWANPSESDFKKRVRKFRSSPDVPREWAAELVETIQKRYSWEAVSEAYDRVLLPLLG